MSQANKYFAGLDIGGSTVKAALVDANGASTEYFKQNGLSVMVLSTYNAERHQYDQHSYCTVLDRSNWSKTSA